MFALQVIVAGLLTVLPLSVIAKSPESMNVKPHRRLEERRTTHRTTYEPFPAADLGAHEVRNGGTPAMSNYILHGLGDIIPLVDQEYGLKNSESFYWGLSMSRFYDGGASTTMTNNA